MKNLMMLVLYDLPTNTKLERKYAQLLRKNLLNAGFYSLQYSVMIRPVISAEWRQYLDKVKRFGDGAPRGSRLLVLKVTDKQFDQRENICGMAIENLDPTSVEQLTII